ncbi:hypothetical protein J4463_00965 [Candidatus Pacearchaeota archaeon]|nr:hypothetical protein [Candidatus Pacearchaeota archaeon]
MAIKNISITKEAYSRPARLKKNKERFSEIIVKITRKTRLEDFFGILSKDAGRKLGENILFLKTERIREYQKRHKKYNSF